MALQEMNECVRHELMVFSFGLLTGRGCIWESGRLLKLDLSNSWIHVFVANREVIGCTASLKGRSTDSMQASQVILTNTWVILAKDMVAKLSLSLTAVGCHDVLGLAYLARVRKSVLAWAWW